ncbi:MAG TPA: acetylornithine transaminase [Verrucomicrobiae bacterium]|jgi:acetylornithine aminotransferase/acetylornithine/N-succinyldiaminopimelate aminotransferase|nr:acetylornithine transaminase [Verrucomicrobiae bacterium]
MKEIIPTPPAVVHNETAEIQALFQKNVIPTYGRFDIVLSHGAGSYVWDITGKRYLDLGGGVAVLALGHSPAAITDTLIEQSRKLIHTSNFYYHGPQGQLAEKLVNLIGPGKCFFANSGVEANEGLFKLARKFGHDEGRFEIITAINSFHGRTLGGIAATGQDKVKKGFEPIIPGFRHVPYNDLAAMRNAISPATAAIFIEGIQGEGGVSPAAPEYLLGLRQLCDEKKLLLMMDSVQCGHFRTGRFQSYQRTLENTPGGDKFMPDAISMAKSLGGGFPIGAFWVRQPYADLLGAGTHGSTFGGSPLGCAVALKILSVIEQEKLADNVRSVGDHLKNSLLELARKYPSVIQNVRGLGFMLGIELAQNIPAFASEGKTPTLRFVNLLHAAGLLAIPASTNIVRLLPPLNLRRSEADEGLKIIGSVVEKLAS